MALLKFEYDCCELSGVTYNLHLHHVLFRSHGGDDVRANIVCMSNELHEAYHRSDAVARLMLAEHVFRKRRDVYAYLALKLGPGPRDLWLEDHGLAYEEIR